MQVFASTTSLGSGRTDLETILPAMMELDLDGIEFGSTHRWRPDLAEIIKASRPSRMLTHNYFPPAIEDMVINLASPDPEIRKVSIAHARACIEFAARVGAELYTVHPGFMAVSAKTTTTRASASAYDFEFVESNVPYEIAFALMRDALGELLDCAHRAGVRLAIETEGSITKPGVLMMETPGEYRRLISELGDALWLNFNLAHSSLAAKQHGFDLRAFISEFGERFAAIEISHNDGHRDSHAPLSADSYVFGWLPVCPDVPLILEFREASPADIANSATMLRRAQQ